MSGPYWLEDDSPRPASRRLGGVPDVEIVGAGITGCAAALALAREGRRVVVHDARGIAEGASGRNGGFALRGGAARYDVARETYGGDESRELWRRTEAALDELETAGGDAVRRVGSLRLAADEEEATQIRGEFAALREDGFEAEWLDELPDHLSGRFLGAIRHLGDGSVQPARPPRRAPPPAAARRGRGGPAGGARPAARIRRGGRGWRVPRAEQGRGARRPRGGDGRPGHGRL